MCGVVGYIVGLVNVDLDLDLEINLYRSIYLYLYIGWLVIDLVGIYSSTWLNEHIAWPVGLVHASFAILTWSSMIDVYMSAASAAALFLSSVFRQHLVASQ